MSGIHYSGRPAFEDMQAGSADLAAAAVLLAVSAFLLAGVTAMVGDFGSAYALAAPATANVAAADCRPADAARRS